MRRSSIVQIISCGTVLGVVVAGNISLGQLVIGVSVFLCLCVLLRRKMVGRKILRSYGLVMIAGVALLLGAVRWQMVLVVKPNDVSRFVSAVSQVITGTIISDPDLIGESQRLILEVFSINKRLASGKARVTMARYPSYEFGQVVQLDCVLQPITVLASSAGLSRQGIGALCSRPTNIHIKIATDTIKGYLFKFKASLQRSLDNVLPEPQSALLAGLLWGSRSNLPDTVKNDFKRSGMSHQVAVSGFNTTIIAAFLSAVLFRLGLNRTAVLVASSLGLASFVVISGASAAVVRAAIMALIVVLARATGRPYEMARALFIAGAGMVAVNPHILAFDMSFQLSFLATLGLIYLSPYFEKKFALVTPRFGIRGIAAATIATQIFVFPLILFAMGRVSIVGFVTNLFVLPMVPATMFAGFLAGLFGFIHTFVAFPFAAVAYLFSGYVIRVSEWFGSLPFAEVQAQWFTLPFLALSYAILFCVLYFKRGSSSFAPSSSTSSSRSTSALFK